MLVVRLMIALSLCLGAGLAHAECRLGDVDAMRERALVHLPATPAAEPMPLVILLHGSTGTGAEMLRDSHLADTADRHGFVVVAPNGGIAAAPGFVWNIPGVSTVTGTLPLKGARDDVAYLTKLADRLVATGCIDGTRVYVTGLSGGGRMASWLGCVAARRFAAIAPVAGLRAGRPLASDRTQADPATCRPDVPLPLLAFSGDADSTNPITGGGASYWRYAQSEALRRWAVLNGCSQPYTANLSTGIYEQGYARCPNGASIAVRVTRSGQHSWSVVDNEEMWTFFSRHRR